MAKKIKLKLSPRLLKKRARRGSTNGKRHCRFTENPELVAQIDYKNTNFLKSFLTERGKILAARVSGTSAHYQRLLSCEIKKARIIGLLPFTGV